MNRLTHFTWIIVVTLLAPVVAAQDAPHDAVVLGRSRDAALYGAFQAGYALAASGDVELAEIVTEFRRAVMIVRQHADMGEYSFNENNLAREMKPYQGVVTFVAQIRLNPMHAYPAPPLYEMYVRTGPESKPISLTGVKREPVLPAGFFETASRFTSFRIEGNATREALAAAKTPTLVITNDHADVIWQARLDLSRYR